MNKKGSKHFTEQERADLLNAILLEKNRDEIAKLLGKSKAAITYELKQNRFLKENKKYRNNCGLQDECEVKNLCKDCYSGLCKFCTHRSCNSVCENYTKEPQCKRFKKFPLICNGCHLFNTCHKNKFIYEANFAYTKSQKSLISSRSHYQFSDVEIAKINAFAVPLVKNGISPDIIVNQINNDPEMPKISLTTFYRFINERAFSFINLDLKRKVRYKPRKSRRN